MSRARLTAVATLATLGLAFAAASPRVARAQDAGSDPLVVAKATELGHDPARIFAFVHDEVGFDPYFGYLRGPRGVLRSRAGNSLDRASLVIALLQASGISSVRYAHGQLDSPQLLATLASLLAAPSRVSGCPTSAYDFHFDGDLGNQVRDHYWAEFDTGGGFQAADPSADALGATLTASLDTFTDIPANVRHRVTISLDVESYSQASAAFAFSGLGRTTVLTQPFDTADLAGKPLSVSAFVRTASSGGLFGVATNTYTPYILVGQGDGDVADDPLILGATFQDVLTNFPLASQFTTAIILSMDVQDPFRVTQHYERLLYDRIGYAARQSGAPVSLSNPTAPAITDFDVTTIAVEPGYQALDAFGPQHDRIQRAHDDLVALERALADITPGGPYTPDQLDVLGRLSTASRALAIVNAETVTMGFHATVDAAERQLARGYVVRPVVDSPRLTLAISRKDGDGAATELDVQKNTYRIVPRQGQNPNSLLWFEVARGLETSFLEGRVLAGVTGQPALSIEQVLTATSADATNDLLVLTADDLDVLAGLGLSDEAKARIGTALAAHRVVLAPAHMVTVGGVTTVGWLETDDTGHTISVFEHGGHQALLEYGNALEFSEEFNKPIANFIGRVAAFGQAGILYTAAVLDAVAEGGGFDGVVKDTKASIEEAVEQAEQANKIFEKMEKAFDKLKLDTKGFGLIGQLADGLMKGFDFATKFLTWITPNDPPVFPFLVNDLTDGLPAVTPGTAPGVNVTVVPDPFFTQDVNGTQVPSVFIVRVQNTGPTTDTFALSLPSRPAGFDVRLGLPAVTVDPGKTGEVSLCLRPFDGVGPPGSSADVSVEAASAADPTVQDTEMATATVPDVEGVAVSLAPEAVSLLAGGTATVTLGLRAVGNVGSTVTLAVDLPAGVSLTGLANPVVLAGPDAVAAETLRLTVDPGVAAGAELLVRVRADFGPMDARQETSADALLSVVDASAQCARDAAVAATTIGRTGLADVLRSLADATNALAANPAGAVERGQVLTFTDKVIAQLTGVTVFAAPEAALGAARDALASADADGIPAALASLDAALCTLDDVMARADVHAIGAVLSPPGQEILPNTATTFTLSVQNLGTSRRTFDLSLGALPSGVTGRLSTTSVTLNPGETGYPPVTVTIDPIADALAPFDFTVTVTDRVAPLSTRTVESSLTVRNELVQIVDVTATPGFADPGGAVSVRVRLYNAVNRERDAQIFLGLRDATGRDAIFPFYGGTVHLDVSANVASLDVPVTIPARLAKGPYTFHAFAGDIPGATGDGPFFVGSPLGATITVTPPVAAPGDATVQTTLTLVRESAPNPKATVRGAVATPSGLARSVVVNGSHAYVCSEIGGSVVDVSDPANPTVVGTFGPWDPVGQSAYTSAVCSLAGGRLVAGFSRGGGSGVPLSLLVYSLGDPANPSAIGPAQTFPRGITGGPAFYDGSVGWIPTNIFVFNPFSNFISRQAGDLFAIDFANAASLVLRGRLFPPPPGDTDATDLYGGHNNSMIFGAQPLPGELAYLATTTATGDGFGTGPGTGRVLVVDVANPDAPTEKSELLWPAPGMPGSGPTLVQGIAVDGATALVAGDTLGFYDAVSGLTGNLTLSALDVTTPAAPTIRSTIVTGLKDRDGTVVVALGGGVFAVAGGSLGAAPSLRNELVLVDASDPASLRYVPYEVGANITAMQKVGDLLYATSSLGLTVFEIGTVNGPSLTVRVRVPKAPGVTTVPGSFSQPPTSTESDADADVYVWVEPASDTLTWQQVAHGLEVAESRAVVLGGTVDFVVPSFGSGQLQLPAAYVEGAQILSIDPTARSNVQLATPASYTLSVKNPTAADVTFDLRVGGIPTDWVSLPASVPVPAGQTVQVPLVVTPGLDAVAFRAYAFNVSATAANGISGQVFASLGTGPTADVGGNPGGVTGGILLDAAPPSAVAGPGNPARFTLHLVNVGNLPDTYQVNPQLPAGWGVGFEPLSLPAIVPGADNARTFGMDVFPPANVAAGGYDIPIAVTSYNGGNYGVKASVHVDVPGTGVSVVVVPFDGTPASAFMLRVRNTGSDADVFDLAVTGVFAPTAMLDSTSVMLAPGASIDVPIRLGALPPLPAGTALLTGTATSRAAPAITASASARVTLPAANGVQVGIVPGDQQRPGPGAGTFIVQITNTGNVEDTYRATITETTGGLHATLRALDGSEVGTVPSLRVLPLATASLTLTAGLDALGDGTVTVQVASLGDPAETASAMGTLHALTPTTTSTSSTTSSTQRPTSKTTTTTVAGSPGPLCGNGTVDPGEQCDPASPTSTCDAGLVCAGAAAPAPCTCTASTAEVCGDCTDNDGNGLTDFEDRACCASQQQLGVALRRVRVTRGRNGIGFTVRAKLASVTGVDPTRQAVWVQLRQAAGGELLCAKLPSDRFSHHGKTYAFRDRTLVVQSARGIGKLLLAVKKNGSASLTVVGKHTQLTLPVSGAAQLTVGFLDPANRAQSRCVGQTVSLKASRNGALVFP